MSSSEGQAVKVCWVIKGYALNTVPFLLVTCQQLHSNTICVQRMGLLLPNALQGSSLSMKESLGTLM